ncbi:MAG: carboxylesterase/lipase family protein, partial [Acidimicrobiales bacterium]
THYGPIAPQNPSPLETMLGAATWASSEDCLSVNVWTPALDDGRRPVMVWLHGGGFVAGSGGVPWYDGAALARRRDVVVVTCNYRLGALGFLRLSHLLGADFTTSGNSGILDQVAALRWVTDNITGFGGDPSRVTIFGESAGGMSVGTLLAVPDAGGLFGRAIAQSGAGHNALPAERAEAITDQFLAAAGIGAANAEAVLDLPVDQLLAAQEKVSTAITTAGLTLAFEPVVDGIVLPQRPVDAVAGGAAAGVPLVVGTTADEWAMFNFLERQNGGIDDATLERRSQRLFGEATPYALAVYQAARPGATTLDLWEAIATDWVFRTPAIRLAEVHASHTPATWMYLFAEPSTAFGGQLRACHAIDIPFVFDNVHRKGTDLFLGTVDEGTRNVAAMTSRAWSTLATTGDPNNDDLPDWPAYDTTRRATMVLDRNPRVVDDPGAAERVLWEGLL